MTTLPHKITFNSTGEQLTLDRTLNKGKAKDDLQGVYIYTFIVPSIKCKSESKKLWSEVTLSLPYINHLNSFELIKCE